MKKTIFYAIFAFLVCLTGLAGAQMGEHLKEEFHDAEAYGIRIVDNLAGLRSALHDDTVRVLAFQSYGEVLDDNSRDELLEWVREGGSVWFYDARLAPHFGMKPLFILAEQIKTKPEKGELGGKERKGMATTVMSLGSHAVQTGVGQVTIFLPEMESDEFEEMVYGAIEVEEGVTALLQPTLEAPALVACRREGRGFIVFKTLLWNEPLSGDRFQMNLLEYSAGYQVPGPAGVGKVGDPPGPEAEYVETKPSENVEAESPTAETHPVQTPAEDPDRSPKETASKWNWNLEMSDGTTIEGELENEMIEFETGTSSLKLTAEDLDSLEFGSSIKLDKMITRKGKSEAGLLLSAPIRFRTSRGVEEFEKDDLVKLFRRPE